MSRKDDIKLLFNFMIELLKEDEEEKEELKVESKQVLTETPKEDESAKYILDIMKRTELMDRMRRTTMGRPTLVPYGERDDDERAKADSEIIKTHEKENKSKNMSEFKNILSNAKEFMDELETKKPLVPSVSLHELTEKEYAKNIIKVD